MGSSLKRQYYLKLFQLRFIGWKCLVHSILGCLSLKLLHKHGDLRNNFCIEVKLVHRGNEPLKIGGYQIFSDIFNNE